MTIDEAIKYVKLFRDEWDKNSKTKNAEALDAAIKFLEEFKKIKDLGECHIIPKNSKWEINGIDVHAIIQELQSYKQGNCTNDCEHFDNAVAYVYEKGIDDFAEALKKYYQCYDIDLCLQDNDHFSYTGSFFALESYIDEIAQQLKAGGKHDD